MTTVTMNLGTSLDEVLAYRHSGVIRRFIKEHSASPREAEELFQEMLKFLYLCYWATTDEAEEFGFAVTSEIEKIDWMWHIFLLFTMDYADFCGRHFGFFLHHMPTEDDDEENGTPEDENALRSRVERQFAMVYDVLGEETLTAWYEHCRYAAPA